jgi:hypothetical protein
MDDYRKESEDVILKCRKLKNMDKSSTRNFSRAILLAADSSFYSHLWVEKNANKYAVKSMRSNRRQINEKFKLHHYPWDIGVNELNRLRIIAK